MAAIGIQVRATAQTVDLRVLARAVEAAGFERLFLPEHTHIPLAVRSLFPDDPAWLDACKRMIDPVIGLATAAAVTASLRLGTGVCLLPQHDPIVLAKTVATLDVLSGGRVLFGVGAGWDEAELRSHGVEPRERWVVMREKALALRAIWTHEEVVFAGQHVRFDPFWQWPKPLQQPHPPLLIGGEGPHVLQHVLAFGDGWIPNDNPKLVERRAALHAKAIASGLVPPPVTAYATERSARRVEELLAAGIERVVINLPRCEPGDELAALEDATAIARPWL